MPSLRHRRPRPTSIGPGELRDFSLPGTVTRRTETPPASASHDHRRAAARNASHPTPRHWRSGRGRCHRPRHRARSRSRCRRPIRWRSARLSRRPSTRRRRAASPPVIETVAPPPAAVPAVDDSGSWLPWLFALLLAAGIGAFFLWRQRNAAPAGLCRRRTRRGTGRDAVPSRHPPRRGWPNPRRRAHRLRRQPRRDRRRNRLGAASGHGSRSSSERRAAVVTDDATTIHFDIIAVQQRRRARARCAGRSANVQRRARPRTSELGAFFGRPAPGRAHPEIAPLARIDMKSAVALPRDASEGI